MFRNPFGEPTERGTAYRGVTHGDGPVRTDRPSSFAFSLDLHWRMGRVVGTATAAALVNMIVPGIVAQPHHGSPRSASSPGKDPGSDRPRRGRLCAAGYAEEAAPNTDSPRNSDLPRRPSAATLDHGATRRNKRTSSTLFCYGRYRRARDKRFACVVTIAPFLEGVVMDVQWENWR